MVILISLVMIGFIIALYVVTELAKPGGRYPHRVLHRGAQALLVAIFLAIMANCILVGVTAHTGPHPRPAPTEPGVRDPLRTGPTSPLQH